MNQFTDYMLEKSIVFLNEDPATFLVVLACTISTCICSIIMFLLSQHLASRLFYYEKLPFCPKEEDIPPN